MLLVTAALVLGAALPTQTPTPPVPPPPPAVVNIPETTINVCAIASLDELTAPLRIEAEAALGAAETTFAELKSLCDDVIPPVTVVPPTPTTAPTPPPTTTTAPPTTTTAPPTSTSSAPVVDDGNVAVVPQGAPETGDGSTEPTTENRVIGLAMLLAALLGGIGSYRAGASRVPGSRC